MSSCIVRRVFQGTFVGFIDHIEHVLTDHDISSCVTGINAKLAPGVKTSTISTLGMYWGATGPSISSSSTPAFFFLLENASECPISAISGKFATTSATNLKFVLSLNSLTGNRIFGSQCHHLEVPKPQLHSFRPLSRPNQRNSPSRPNRPFSPPQD